MNFEILANDKIGYSDDYPELRSNYLITWCIGKCWDSAGPGGSATAPSSRSCRTSWPPSWKTRTGCTSWPSTGYSFYWSRRHSGCRRSAWSSGTDVRSRSPAGWQLDEPRTKKISELSTISSLPGSTVGLRAANLRILSSRTGAWSWQLRGDMLRLLL